MTKKTLLINGYSFLNVEFCVCKYISARLKEEFCSKRGSIIVKISVKKHLSKRFFQFSKRVVLVCYRQLLLFQKRICVVQDHVTAQPEMHLHMHQM